MAMALLKKHVSILSNGVRNLINSSFQIRIRHLWRLQRRITRYSIYEWLSLRKKQFQATASFPQDQQE